MQWADAQLVRYQVCVIFLVCFSLVCFSLVLSAKQSKHVLQKQKKNVLVLSPPGFFVKP